MPGPFALKRHPSGELAWGTSTWKGLAWASLMLLLGLATAAGQAAPAAGPYIVNDPADLPGVPPLTDGHCAAINGKCTLRAAVMEANHPPGNATISLPTGTFSLTIPAAGPDDETTGDLNISTTVTIQGAGAGSTIIDANGGTTLDRAFSVGAGAALSLSRVTIRGGAVTTNGGGILNAGRLSLDHSAVISNTVGSPGNDGGGLFTSGQALTVTDSLISGNHANGFGGGIEGDSGTVTLVRSTIAGNKAEGNGGGLDNATTLSVYSTTIANNTAFNGGGVWAEGAGSTILLQGTTVSGNSASPNAGGGLAQEGGTTNLVNSTFSGNQADVDGGGIWNSCPCASVVNLYNVTVTDNQADANLDGSGTGGGVFNNNNGINTVQPLDSLIADNWATALLIHVHIRRANDCHGPVTSLDFNLIGTTSDCTFTQSPDDQLNVPAGIGPLQNNGGPAWTHALLPGSLAIDSGALNGCRDQNGTLLATDQRGYPRMANGAGTTRCDIGAFELQRIIDLPLVRR